MTRCLTLILLLSLVCTACKKNDHLTHIVVINQMKFNPSVIEVNLHDSIVFINKDIVAHDVTEAKARKWTSSALEPGKSWTMIVQEDADFYCTIHPMMRGKVKVR